MKYMKIRCGEEKSTKLCKVNLRRNSLRIRIVDLATGDKIADETSQRGSQTDEEWCAQTRHYIYSTACQYLVTVKLKVRGRRLNEMMAGVMMRPGELARE